MRDYETQLMDYKSAELRVKFLETNDLTTERIIERILKRRGDDVPFKQGYDYNSIF